MLIFMKTHENIKMFMKKKRNSTCFFIKKKHIAYSRFLRIRKLSKDTKMNFKILLTWQRYKLPKKT